MKPSQNIAFDRITRFDDSDRKEIKLLWEKDGKPIHSMVLTDIEAIASPFPFCRACLKWRGKKVEMSIRKVITFKEYDNVLEREILNEYSFRQCPECKGLDAEECTCGEIPHRISCPMGFYLYFQIPSI